MVERVQLRVTGDDFGRSAEVNRAFSSDWQSGFLTQASLMPGAPAAKEALQIAGNHPAQVGLHLTLCDGLALTDCPLADTDRQLPASASRVGWQIWARRGDADFMQGLRDEIEAQFAWVREQWPDAHHWDGHHHLHLHPVIFPIAAHFAARYRFNRVRLLLKPERVRMVSMILSSLSRTARGQATRSGQRFDDWVFGLAQTGQMTDEKVFHLLRQIERLPPANQVELYYHPGAEPSALKENFGAWAREAFPAIQWAR